MAKPGAYQEIIVESFRPACTNGLHGPIHIRPLPGQGLHASMMVECSKSLSYAHPVGTLFRIRAKITDKQGGTPFLYSHYSWPVSTVSAAEAEKHIRDNSPWSW
jgi:hypothetical protein